MVTNKFFVCPNCGNVKVFRVFTSNFQVIVQSPEQGACIDKSGVLPNLRQHDNFVECQVCFRKSDYDTALSLGKKYIKNVAKLEENLKDKQTVPTGV